MTDGRIITATEKGPTYVRITQDERDGAVAVTVDGQPVGSIHRPSGAAPGMPTRGAGNTPSSYELTKE